MHFSTPLILLSGATAALAGSFAAPAHPGHHAIRQATRDQVVRRQVHGMQKVKRAAASPIPGICGANIPASMVLQLSGIDTTTPQGVYQNNYAAFQPSNAGNVLVPVEAFSDATELALVGTAANACNLRSASEPTIIANSGGGDSSPVFFNSARDIADYAGIVGACTADGDVLSCAFGPNTEWDMCTVPESNPASYYLAINEAGSALDGCTPVTVSFVSA